MTIRTPAFFDRQGHALTLHEWADLAARPGYSAVAHDRIGDSEVSTVWVGVTHARDRAPRGIFESLVFSSNPELDQTTTRTSTEPEARVAHAQLVGLVLEARS